MKASKSISGFRFSLTVTICCIFLGVGLVIVYRELIQKSYTLPSETEVLIPAGATNLEKDNNALYDQLAVNRMHSELFAKYANSLSRFESNNVDEKTWLGHVYLGQSDYAAYASLDADLGQYEQLLTKYGNSSNLDSDLGYYEKLLVNDRNSSSKSVGSDVIYKKIRLMWLKKIHNETLSQTNPAKFCFEPIKFLGEINGASSFACNYGKENQKIIWIDNESERADLMSRVKTDEVKK